MVKGYKHLSIQDRASILKDLRNLAIPLEDIVNKHEINIRTVYVTAQRAKLDMGLRGRIIKMEAEKKRLERKIMLAKKEFRSR